MEDEARRKLHKHDRALEKIEFKLVEVSRVYNETVENLKHEKDKTDDRKLMLSEGYRIVPVLAQPDGGCGDIPQSPTAMNPPTPLQSQSFLESITNFFKNYGQPKPKKQ